MHAVSKNRQIWPTSMRLVDNTQFQMGSSLKPTSPGKWHDFIEAAKKFFVVNVKGYDPEKLAACTMLFEGDETWVNNSHRQVLEIAKQFQGMAGGEENGKRGYLLTFLIAYVRDFAMQHHVIAESFETSVPWSRVPELCRNVDARLRKEAAVQGFPTNKIWCSFRVTQLYETGAAVYVYMALNHNGLGMDRSGLVEKYEIVENAARDEVMNCGGCISHHHGVGKIRKRFVERTMPEMAVEWNNSIKSLVDPTNIFGINNTFIRSEAERTEIFSKSNPTEKGQI